MLFKCMSRGYLKLEADRVAAEKAAVMAREELQAAQLVNEHQDGEGQSAAKLEAVCAEYYAAKKDLNEPYDEMLKRLLALLNEFPNAPFTVQRLCELLLDPHRIYATSTRKVTSALEKLLTVSSTVPTMVVAQPKPGTYQAASETQLSQLVGGDGAEAMDVEN